MVFDFLAHMLLGFVLAFPLWLLIRFAAIRSGLWTPRLYYVRPYVYKAQRTASPPVFGKQK